MFQPQENHHCVPGANWSGFAYVPVPVYDYPKHYPEHYPEHYPNQPPNVYPQPLSIGIYKLVSFMPSFQAPYYDGPFMDNTQYTPAQEWAADPNPDGRETSFNEPVALTATVSSPEPMSSPEALAETERIGIQDSNNGGQEMCTDQVLSEPVSLPETVSLLRIASPFEPVTLPRTTFLFKPVSPPWTSFPFEHGPLPCAVPPFEYVPLPCAAPLFEHVPLPWAAHPFEHVHLPCAAPPFEYVPLPCPMPPFQHVPLPCAAPPFEHVPLPCHTPPFQHVPLPCATPPFEHVPLNYAAPPFEHVSPHNPVPPPKPFIKTEQKLEVQLFIGGLDFSIDKQQLYMEFLPFGDLIGAKVIMKNGRSKGYGFVVYSNHIAAETAIREMNGKVIGKTQLLVALSKSKEKGQKMMSGLGITGEPQGQS